jgi:hypothetical protein
MGGISLFIWGIIILLVVGGWEQIQIKIAEDIVRNKNKKERR